MIKNNEYKNEVQKILKELELKANKYFAIKTFNYTISYSLKSTRVMGTFFRNKDKLELHFHPGIIAIFGIEKYRSTIVHEFAHMIAYMLFGCSIRPHGKEWRKIMRIFGEQKPRATTSEYSFYSMKLKLKVNCGCGERRVSLKNFFLVHSGNFSCKTCKNKFY